MRAAIFLVTLICSYSACFPQTGKPLPLSNVETRKEQLLDAISTRYKKDLGSVRGGNKKYIADIYKERFELIKKTFEDNEIITDEKASAYLSALANEILAVNKFLDPADLRIVFSNSWLPNASSMGEGTILFNIGLFHRLENESQAAFVLCHELAHYYLDHGNKNIEEYVNTLYSDAFQKQLKSIQKSEYRQNQQLESLAKNLTFKNRRHSRQFEQAADSMAVELMKNTRYDLDEALKCLALLDSVDKDKYEGKLDLNKRFDFSAFRFKSTWLESDMLIFTSAKDEEEKAEKDSLKTHPDCITRIEKLKDVVKKYNKPSNKKFIVGEEQFYSFKQQFDYSILTFLFDNKKVSRCLYYALSMLNHFPQSAQLHAMIGKCLNEIYSRQKAHELGKIVDLPGPEVKEEYNKLLNLIQNLRLREIAALSYYYMDQYRTAHANEQDFASVWNTCKENFNNNY